MKKLSLLVLMSVFVVGMSIGQKTALKLDGIGIQYYGELAFHPGIEIDFNYILKQKSISKIKRTYSNQFSIRPSISYYHVPNYTNNFIISPSFNYQLKVSQRDKQGYYFIEPFIKAGYMRYSYIGEIYVSTSGGFEKRNIGGGNAFVLASGFYLGGSVIPDCLDWMFAGEYMTEFSEDDLFIQHIVFKLGIRYKLTER